LLVILGLTFGVVFFDRNAMSYLAPFVVADLRLSNTQVGMLASALSLTWALSAYGIAALSDATGRRKSILIVCIVIFSLSSVGSGLAMSLSMLIVSRLFMGLSEGGILPISQSLLAIESDPARRGLNMGVMQNFGSNLFGSFVAPLLLVAIASAWGWRQAFFVAAVPGFLCALLIALYVREPARHEIPRSGNSESEQPPAHAPAMGAIEMLRHRNMWLCVLVSCVMVAWMVLGWTFLPLYYTKVRQIAPSGMSWLMATLGISAMVFSILVPGLSDRIGRRPVMIVFSAIGALVPLAALHFEGPLVALSALVFIGWSASGVFPLFMATIPSETVSVRYVATATGVVVGIGEITGGFLSPTVAGRAADVFGLEAPLYIMIGCTIVATLLALFLQETAPSRAPRAQSTDGALPVAGKLL
jgi:predicted MFS family arabinose efflux permease